MDREPSTSGLTIVSKKGMDLVFSFPSDLMKTTVVVES